MAKKEEVEVWIKRPYLRENVIVMSPIASTCTIYGENCRVIARIESQDARVIVYDPDVIDRRTR